MFAINQTVIMKLILAKLIYKINAICCELMDVIVRYMYYYYAIYKPILYGKYPSMYVTPVMTIKQNAICLCGVCDL